MTPAELRYDAKFTHRQIAEACRISKGTVGKFVNLAEVKGVGWPLPEEQAPPSGLGFSEPYAGARIARYPWPGAIASYRKLRLARVEPDSRHAFAGVFHKGLRELS